MIQGRNTRFAHYTSAEAAMSLLRSNRVWLRNSLLMNDFSEVQHGKECLRAAWRDEALGGRMKALLNRWEQGLDKKLEEAFDARHDDQHTESFLLSISEHGSNDVDEDQYGRLSMWRAYGGTTNVAFVFNNHPFMSPSDALKAYSSPVLYRDPEGFKIEFKELVDSLEANEDFIGNFPPDGIVAMAVWAFHAAVLSTKHPGFAEEREWRVIYSPTIEHSDKIEASVETIGGVPQRVYKIPLVNHPEEGFTGATIPELLDRIIIGPTQYPWPIYDAFVEELRQRGVPDAASRVFVSDIPLRR
jgi:hypothetical protein